MTFDEAVRTARQIREVYGHLGVSAVVNGQFVPFDHGYCIDLQLRVRGRLNHLHHVKRLWGSPEDMVGGLGTIMDLWFRQIDEQEQADQANAPPRISSTRLVQDWEVERDGNDVISWATLTAQHEVQQDVRYGPIVRAITQAGHIVARDTDIGRAAWTDTTIITVTVYDGGPIEEEVPPPNPK